MRKMDGGADLGYESRKDRSLMEKILVELPVGRIRQMPYLLGGCMASSASPYIGAWLGIYYSVDYYSFY